MLNAEEIVAEARAQASKWELNWQLPWYAGANDPVWGHDLVRIMLNLPAERFDEVMGILIDEDSFALRGIALHLVNARGRDEFKDAVRARLDDESMPVRALAATALGGIGLDDNGIQALAARPDDEHPEVKKAIVSAFRLERHPGGRAMLVRWVREEREDEGVLVAAAAALGDMGGDDAVAALADLLGRASAPDEPRKAAARGLANIGGPAAIAALRTAATDSRPWVRAESLAALGRLDGDASWELIEAATAKNEPWMVRGHACEAMGACPEERALPALRRLARDAEPRVRSEACAALGRLGGPAAIACLRRALDDAELLVRAQAVGALTRATGESFGIERETERDQIDRDAIERAVARARRYCDAR